MDNNYQNYNYAPMQQPVQPVMPTESVAEKKPKNFKKLLVKLIALVLIVAVAGGGIYAFLYNFVFFPTLDEALMLSLEPKFSLNTNFKFDSFAEKGTLKVEASDLGIEAIETLNASISFDTKKKAFGVFGTFNDEKVTLIATEKGMAVNENNFEGGQYYGMPLEDFIEKFEDSIFGPDSDTKYSIPTEVFDAIKQAFDTLDQIENEDLVKDLETVVTELMTVVAKSELAKSENKYFGVEVAGESRGGRSQTFNIDEKKVRDLIKDLAEAFENPSKKFDKALDNVLGYIDDSVGSAPDADDIAEALGEAAKAISNADIEFDVSIKFVYVGRALSALEVDLSVPMGDSETSFEAVVDFGAKPQKDTTIALDVTVENEYKYDGETYTNKIEINGTYELKNDTKGVNEIVVKGEMKTIDDGDEGAVYKLDGSLTLDANAGSADLKGDMTYKATYDDGETYEYSAGIFANAEYQDTKDTWSIKPLKFGMYDGDATEEMEMPFDVTLSLLTSVEKLNLPKYENILEMSEEEMDDLLDLLADFGKELGEKYSGMGDLGGSFDDIVGGGSYEGDVTPVPEQNYPSPY